MVFSQFQIIVHIHYRSFAFDYRYSSLMHLLRIIQFCVILVICQTMQVRIRDFIPTNLGNVLCLKYVFIFRVTGFAMVAEIFTNTLISKTVH